MDVVSIAPCFSEGFLLALLSNMQAVPTAAIPTTIHLFTAGPTIITPGFAVSDFTEATYTGYTAQTFSVPAAPINLPSGLGQGFLLNWLFPCTTAPASPGQSILGYWAEFGASLPAMAEIFPTPVPIVLLGDYVNLTLTLPLQWVNQVAA